MGIKKEYPIIKVKNHGFDAYNKVDSDFGFKVPTNSMIHVRYGYLEPTKLVHIEIRPSRKVRIFECICHRCGNTCLANERGLREGGKKSCGCLERDNLDQIHIDIVKDYTGWKLDMLTAQYRVEDPNDPNYGKWCFKCECGNLYYGTPSILVGNKRGHPHTIVSCGCMTSQLRSEGIIRSLNSHGMYNSKLYNVYIAMIERCYNPNNPRYPVYGGRGIYICDEWRTPGVHGNPGFVNFMNWAYNNGYYDQPNDTPFVEKLTIDRIDNDGPYAPWNCRWVTNKVQSNNKSTNRHLCYNGKIYTFAQFRELFSIKDQVYLHEYVNKGKSLNVMVYNFIHWQEPDKKLHFDKNKGMWVNKDGFVILIPKYDIELLD